MCNVSQNEWMSGHYPISFMPQSVRAKIANHIDGSLSPNSGYMIFAEHLGFDIGTSNTIYIRSIGNHLVSSSPTINLLQHYAERGGTVQAVQLALLQMRHIAADVIPSNIHLIENNFIQQTGNTSVANTEHSQCNCVECIRRQNLNISWSSFLPLSHSSGSPSANPDCKYQPEVLSHQMNKELINKSCDKNVSKNQSNQNSKEVTKNDQRPKCVPNSRHQMMNVRSEGELNLQSSSERNVSLRPAPLGSSETELAISGSFTSVSSNLPDQEQTNCKVIFSSPLYSGGSPYQSKTMAHHLLSNDSSNNVPLCSMERIQEDHCFENQMENCYICQKHAQTIVKKGSVICASKHEKADKSSTTMLRHSWHNQHDNSNKNSSLSQSSSDSQLSVHNILHAQVPEGDLARLLNQVTLNSNRHGSMEHHIQDSIRENRNSFNNLGHVYTDVPTGPEQLQNQRNNRDKFVFLTYSFNSQVDSESFLKEFIALCKKFRQFNIRVRTDMDSDTYRHLRVNKIDWIEKMFNEACLIIVCVTPTYAIDIEHPTGNMANPSVSQLNAHYIYNLIRGEYYQNRCQNYRVIPVIFKNYGTTVTHVPMCMRSTYVYTYPDDAAQIVRRAL